MDGRNYLLISAAEGKELVSQAKPRTPCQKQPTDESHSLRRYQSLPLEWTSHAPRQVD